MAIYLKPIISACYVFPVLAALFTLPYILYEYHKYGALLVIRTGIVYTFIFYMLTSYFMTILPLPPLDSVTPDSACMLLVPFDAVKRVIENAPIDLSDVSTYVNIFKCADFWQIIFNILLLLPFGVYLRYYFKRSWWQVIIFSFMYSLFFELTQLSGLYGIYQYPYRFFEVDDLICNTLGGLVGYLITPLLVFMLPDRDRIDEIAYKKGQIVSEFRRGFAWIIDIAVIMLPVIALCIYFNKNLLNVIYNVKNALELAAYIALVFIFITTITGGKTLGKAVVSVKLVRKEKDNKSAAFAVKNNNEAQENKDYDSEILKTEEIIDNKDNLMQDFVTSENTDISTENIKEGNVAAKNIVKEVVAGLEDSIDTNSSNTKLYKKPGFIRIAARYIILYIISIPSLVYAYACYNILPDLQGWKFYVCIAACIAFVMIAVYTAFDLLLCLFSKTRDMLYDRLTRITHKSITGEDKTF